MYFKPLTFPFKGHVRARRCVQLRANAKSWVSTMISIRSVHISSGHPPPHLWSSDQLNFIIFEGTARPARALWAAEEALARWFSSQ